MKINLHFAYWSLFFISLISSSVLFLIVASETIKSSDQNINGKGSNNVIENNIEQSTSTLIDNNHKKLDNLNCKRKNIERENNYDNDSPKDFNNGNGNNILDINNHKISDDSNKIVSVSDIDKIKVPKIKKIKRFKKDIDKNVNDDKHNLQTDELNNETVAINEEIQNIPANPAVITLGENTPELIVDNTDNYEKSLLSESDDNVNKTEQENRIKTDSFSTISNDFVILSEVKPIKRDTIVSHDISPNERLQQINDSGGSAVDADGINAETIKTGQIQSSHEYISSNDTLIKHDIPIQSTTSAEVNLTTEEHPIPVFSEWAQKQMEEAEKQLEKEVVNSSTMKKNATNGMGKPQMLKLRTKNYASPDCGAKIIASNIEAQNTGALLTTSKDEYMLSPCTNRIWFVVELCEAIQAKQIDLANFELFSSSPKNFTVAVSNRYPTRDWSNVGRFIAEDSRNIQSFELYPHLFGKYVRVDIHSHYNSEHFCPISLFRVYGTSEFEAFETENRNPYDDLDDDDIVVTGVGNNGGIDVIGSDEDLTSNDNNNLKKENQNLFRSASDAVMSIVKKAAQVLVKEKPNETELTNENVNGLENHKNDLCFSLKLPNFECNECSQTFNVNVNYLLSCKYQQLIKLLKLNLIKNDIIKSRICANRFNIDLTTVMTTSTINNLNINISDNNSSSKSVSVGFHEKNSFYLSIIPLDYLAAICHILKESNSILKERDRNKNYFINDSALNLTIDKKNVINEKNNNVDFIYDENLKNKNKIENEIEMENDINNKNLHNVPIDENSELIQKTNDVNDNLENNEPTQIPTPPLDSEESEPQKKIVDPKETVSGSDGVNIFNLVIEDDKSVENSIEIDDQLKKNADSNEDNIKIKEDSQLEDIKDGNVEEVIVPVTITPIQPPLTPTQPSAMKQKDPDVTEPASWDSIDKFLSEQISGETTTVGGGGNGNSGGSNNYQVQHKSGHHSESVFIRLSNRIKALERNMSLSGQYLEELSRRYKKQVEELQNSFAKTLSAIEDQNRRAAELEQFLVEQNYNLKENLEDLAQKFYFWISILLCVATVVLIHVLISWYSVSSIGRKQIKLLEKYEECSMVQNKQIQKRLQRRKSVEGVSGHPTPTHKIRRPSEQAMRITGSYKDLMIFEEDENLTDHDNQITESDSALLIDNKESSWSKDRLKSELVSVSSSPSEIEEIFPRQRKSSVYYSKENQPFQLFQQLVGSKTKKFHTQESASGDFTVDVMQNNITQNSTQTKSNNLLQQQQKSGIPEEILTVDDDYEYYLPGSDLVYNEFMPDGPSGYQNNEEKNQKLNGNFFSSKKKGKLRKLSSPGFLKSTFSKNGISGGGENGHINSKKNLPSTESTGWEWYRLKKSNSNIKTHQQQQQQNLVTEKQKQDKINKNPLKPEIILRINGNSTVGSCGSAGSSISKNSDTEFLILNSSNCSESDSLITTNSEETSNCGPGGHTNNGSNNLNNKRNTKKQRSFKKMFKKVF